MEWYLYAMIGGAIICLLALGLFKVVPKKNKNLFLAIGGAALLVGAVFWYGGGVGPFAVTEEDGTVVVDTTAGEQKAISTLRVTSLEEFTNSRTAYYGQIRFYEADANLDDSLVADNSYLDTVTLAAGTGSTTNAILRTDTPYQFATYNATDGTWYNEFGTVTFASSDYNEQVATYTWDMGADGYKVIPMANLTDPLTEAYDETDINGQSNSSQGATAEVQCASLPCANDDALLYDESVGDGDYYIQFVISATGGNKAIKESVLCFQHESGAEPEGSEYTVITAEHVSGTEILGTSDLLNAWKNADCIQMGTINGGQSETVKVTFTVNEAQLDTSDDFKLIIDDLGGASARDYLSVKGTNDETIDFDAQA